MSFSFLADIKSAFESFFVSLTSSVSFNLIFLVSLGLEVFFMALFAILSRFSYESRMRRSLDKLNRWLFKHKNLDKENIKEFNTMVKKAPKRLNVNWQQYILYREKAPSEYMSVDNIIEKPLRTSSFAANIKNMTWVSLIWALFSFVVCLSSQNFGGTVIDATMIIISMVAPILIGLMCMITVMILRARKNVNLDELYQNLHIFDRFIDNACVDLPPYIDYSLLFTAQEIDKGIPALREYLESRARKEKEEFDKIAEEENTTYEKYNFEELDIYGQNILERAMKESEAYLSKKSQTLVKISQIEETLETLKRNFANVQKDFQKSVQVSKENMEMLRRQQEETTSRIESGAIRKRLNDEVTKQEKRQADYNQQQDRYAVEKSEYEEAMKSLYDELDSGKNKVEEAMLSEYETFYGKIFNTAVEEAENKVKDKIQSLTEAKAETEEDLTIKEAQLKRVIDENETLKRKLGMDYETIEIESAKLSEVPEEEKKVEEEHVSKLITPEQVAQSIKEKQEEKQGKNKKHIARFEETEVAAAPAGVEEESKAEEAQPKEVEEIAPVEEVKPVVEEYVPSAAQEEEEEKDEKEEETAVATPVEEAKPAAEGTKRRGRPKKGEEKTIEELVANKRGRGRPRKAVEEVEAEPAAPKKRGRPVGTTKKPKVEEPVGEKRGRGRPKKETTNELNNINEKINAEQKRLENMKAELDNKIQKAIVDLDAESSKKERRDEILNEISALKEQVEKAKQENASVEIEKLNAKIEGLLTEIQNLND